MILLIDNYDSFTYNLYQLIGKNTDEAIQVVRNDQVTIDEIIDLNPSHIVISPGPGRPENAGVTVAVRHRKYPMFGVQFHPESILTPSGETMIQNFLKVGGNTHD
ncbi:glutamine amidotransferase-related protein [Aerococcus urinaeequi]|uniref:glutamine amidotransferase-related protein n=1 Tax=Aerococcus urinaeequi TaxID=51665 RepID=UPI003D6BAAB4